MVLPVTIIGGYLGAGKTTLVNRMLRQANGARIAVLVNEFGELPIDEDLIEARDEDLISIAGGCICCSFGNDLMAALGKIAAFDPAPDHIVIESSGVALPAAIASSVSILDGVQVEGICVLADALNIRRLSRDEYIGDTIERQLADADIVVITKADLAAQKDLEDLEDWLTKTWPSASIITAAQGNVPKEVLLGRLGEGRSRVPSPHADAMYQSITLHLDSACDAEKLAQKLTDPSLGILRAKGHVDDISGRRALIQLVGQRAETSFPDETHARGVICIGLKSRLDRDAIDRVVAECLAPDRRAG